MRLVQKNGQFGLQKTFCGIPMFGEYVDLDPGFDNLTWSKSSRHYDGCWGAMTQVNATLLAMDQRKEREKVAAIQAKIYNKIVFIDYIEPNFCERLRIRLLKLVGYKRGNSGIVANG